MRELLARVDSRELTEWMAYAELEPFGERRADLRAAEIAWVMANLWKGKNQMPYEMDDFLLAAGRSEPAGEMTPEQMLATAKAAFGVGG